MAKVTMKQIADRLGISTDAVSLVLNDKSGVGEEMRKKVLQAAEEMGYLDQEVKYNKSYQSRNICVMMKREYFRDMHFYSKVLYGIEKEAALKGYDVIIQFTDDTIEVPVCVERQKVAGVIIVGIIEEKRIRMLKECGIPIVLVDHCSYSAGLDCILSDNCAGSWQATHYLLEKGYRKIGFFGDPKYSVSTKERFWGYSEAIMTLSEAEDREAAFRYVMRFSVLDNVEEAVIAKDTDTAVRWLREISEMPEAFVCSNDRAALLLNNALNMLGFKVPDDVALVGFDDIEMCTMVMPQITTLHVGKYRMGVKAVDTLIWRVKNKKAPLEKVLLPVELVERESVK